MTCGDREGTMKGAGREQTLGTELMKVMKKVNIAEINFSLQ